MTISAPVRCGLGRLDLLRSCAASADARRRSGMPGKREGRQGYAPCCAASTPRCNKRKDFRRNHFPKIACSRRIRAWMICMQPCGWPAWWRNHVPWRLAYWRCQIAAPPRRLPAAISPAQMADSSGTPCAFIAGRRGSSPSASSARTSSSAPAASMAVEAPVDGGAQRLARRVEQDGGEAPRRRAGHARPACQAVSDRPVARQTSQARTRRWLSPGFRRGRRLRIALRQRRMKAGAPSSASSARASARAAGRHRRNVGQALGQRPRNKGRCRRRGSAAGPPPGRRDLRQRHRPPPGDAAALRRRADAVQPVRRRRLLRRRRPGGQDRQLAVDLHASALMTVPPNASREAQRQRRLAAGGRAGDDDAAGWQGHAWDCIMRARFAHGPAQHVPDPDPDRRPRRRLASPHLLARRAAPAGARRRCRHARLAGAGGASDIPFDGLNADRRSRPLHVAALDDAPVDVIAQPAAGRRKRLLLADMESTIIEHEMLDELADLRRAEGRRSPASPARAMNGEIDFAAALHERVGLLEGLPVDSAGARPGSATALTAGRARPGRHHEGARRALRAGLRRLHLFHRPGARTGSASTRITPTPWRSTDGTLTGTVGGADPGQRRQAGAPCSAWRRARPAALRRR